MLRGLGAIVLTSWLFQDCTPDMKSVDETWVFTQENLVDQGFSGSPYRVLVGSTVCPLATNPPLSAGHEIDAEQLIAACVHRSGTGSVSAEANCFTVDSAGDGEWRFEPAAECPYLWREPAASDAVQISGIALDDVTSAPETALQAFAGQPGATGPDVPADVAIGDTLFVLGVGLSEVRVRLIDSEGERVAWPLEEDALTLEGGEVQMVGRGRIVVRMPAGKEGVVQAHLPGGTVDLVRVVGVANRDVVSMEIVSPLQTVPLEQPIEGRVFDDDTLTVVDQVWAIYRDREGHIVWGVPTEWETKFSRQLLRSPDPPNPSRLLLLDGCEPFRAGSHSVKATARSTLRTIDLETTDTLRYRFPRSTIREMRRNGDIPEDVDPDDRCAAQASGGCVTISAGPAMGWALVLGGLVMLGRRRDQRQNQP